MRFIVTIFVCLTLAACGSAPNSVERRDTSPATLPPMKTFTKPRVPATVKSNAAIAQDFMELSFELESGRQLPVFTRFEGPITLRVTGNVPPSLSGDLTRLLTRLRREANIRITRVPADQSASITVQVITRRELQAMVPGAACFVAPEVSSWDEFSSTRRKNRLEWDRLTLRTKMAVFLPGNVSPQEIRDCLHEEIAQALGPVNDLYRLSDSIFNDDNFHTVLTGLDMLILRAYYDPSLRSGMKRNEVAARLPSILARINPRGESGGPSPQTNTPASWSNAINEAMSPRRNKSRRRAAAKRAVSIALSEGWNDNRLAFSFFALGRLSLGAEPEVALSSFLNAGRLYEQGVDTEVHAAHVAMQIAAFELSAGRAEVAMNIVNLKLPAVMRAENAALLATLLMVKAEALEILDRPQEAKQVRLDSLGWARYGFGSAREVRARAAEIAAISPRSRQRG